MTNKIIHLKSAQRSREKRAKKPERHPEEWMMVSPTAFELASGIKISDDELKGVREAIYEIYSKAKN